VSGPPGIARTSALGCSTGSEDRIDKVIRAAHKALAESGVSMSPRKVSKIVRRFGMNARKSGVSFHEYLSAEANLSPAQRRYLAANPDLQIVIAYADPTGETAVNNVMRGRG
jgi:trimethylamine:corrinoid methyltransferase-like protein